jgi:putative transposase
MIPIMPRTSRQIEPGGCYHVINRGNGRQVLFHKTGDYQAFLQILAEGLRRFDVALLCWCLMPNHWHLVLRPRSRRAMIDLMRWVTVTHVRRHHAHYQADAGHLYQGRYKSFPVGEDRYFLVLCRYVEANALRARRVKRAEDWRWSSLHQRMQRVASPPPLPLGEWPVQRPRGWGALVNEPLREDEERDVRISMERERPFGDPAWVRRIAAKLGLGQTLRPRGRPRKPVEQLSLRQRQRRAKASGVVKRSGGQKGK